MNVVSLREFVFVIVGSVVLSLLVLAVVFPWVRHARTLIVIALTTTIGIVIWNALLNLTNTTPLNVDSPLFGLSVQDVGSGIGAFLVSVVVLRFVTNKNESVGGVLAVSAVVGLITVLVDLFG